ncbi:MAG: M50 family metallopeptidase [Pseudomonadota bacterium]|nr:M50 family metallopeptidase [Pseudomonadota bacterium]
MSRVKERTGTRVRLDRADVIRRKGAGGGGRGSAGTLGRVGLVGGVLLAVLAGWYAAPLVYPLRLLTVLLHEGGHAAVTLLTGGTVVEIAVNAEESGHTLSSGGIHFLILQGGYLGSLLAGLVLTAAPRAARGPCVVLGLLALLALGWIPIVSFGFLYTALVGAGLLALAWKASHELCRGVLRAIGLFVVADAVRDVLSDLGRGDAALLAEMTGVPALLWSGMWLAAAIGLLVWAVRRAG